MRLATVDESRDLDQLAQTEYDLTGEVLMEAAGVLAAGKIEAILRRPSGPARRDSGGEAYTSYAAQADRPSNDGLRSKWNWYKSPLIAIVCGPGHNGGDGLVVARHLHARGFSHLKVFILGANDSRSTLYQKQVHRCHRQGVEFCDLRDNPRAIRELLQAGIIVDGIFGIGLRAPLEPPYSEVVAQIISARTQRGVQVISLDVPSGLDADTGMIRGQAVRADLTLTFGLAKPGFFIADGPRHVGHLRVLPIGFPAALVARCANSHFAFHPCQVARYLPSRKATSNKSQHGHAMIFAGSQGMWGAGVLASRAAYRVGAGYVTLASHQDPSAVLQEVPEILTSEISDERVWNARRWQVAAIGPGLGVGDKTADLLRRLKDLPIESVVVDADAITVAAKEKLFPLPSTWIVTPHAGELSRVLSVSATSIESDRYRWAHEAAAFMGCHVLLKGFRSIVAAGDRRLVILSGNSALAKAGTGDVLTGMIVGLLAQKLKPHLAAVVASTLHGYMADEWVRSKRDRRGLLAGDLCTMIPGALRRLNSVGSRGQRSALARDWFMDGGDLTR